MNLEDARGWVALATTTVGTLALGAWKVLGPLLERRRSMQATEQASAWTLLTKQAADLQMRVDALEAENAELRRDKDELQERLLRRVEDEARAREELRDKLLAAKQQIEIRRSTPPRGTRTTAPSAGLTTSLPPPLPQATRKPSTRY